MAFLDDKGMFAARNKELIMRAANGGIAVGSFLTLAEQADLLSLADSMGERERVLLWGGYDEAERKKAFFLPDRLLPIEELGDSALIPDIYLGAPVCALMISGSGYRELTNRDFLGAILNLGIERDSVGDIRTDGPSRAFVICDAPVGALITDALERVGRDAVKIKEISFTELQLCMPKREYDTLSDTVSAKRLDAVVSSLCRVSREKAKVAVASGAVQCGGKVCEKPDREVCEGEIVSVKGHGKFRIVSLSDVTKKGRYRLIADKYK